MKLDRHGRKLENIKNTAGWMASGLGERLDVHYQLMYNADDDHVFACIESDDDHRVFADDAIIRICSTKTPMSMQDISDAVDLALRLMAAIV